MKRKLILAATVLSITMSLASCRQDATPTVTMSQTELSTEVQTTESSTVYEEPTTKVAEPSTEPSDIVLTEESTEIYIESSQPISEQFTEPSGTTLTEEPVSESESKPEIITEPTETETVTEPTTETNKPTEPVTEIQATEPVTEVQATEPVTEAQATEQPTVYVEPTTEPTTIYVEPTTEAQIIDTNQQDTMIDGTTLYNLIQETSPTNFNYNEIMTYITSRLDENNQGKIFLKDISGPIFYDCRLVITNVYTADNIQELANNSCRTYHTENIRSQFFENYPNGAVVKREFQEKCELETWNVTITRYKFYEYYTDYDPATNTGNLMYAFPKGHSGLHVAITCPEDVELNKQLEEMDDLSRLFYFDTYKDRKYVYTPDLSGGLYTPEAFHGTAEEVEILMKCKNKLAEAGLLAPSRIEATTTTNIVFYYVILPDTNEVVFYNVRIDGMVHPNPVDAYDAYRGVTSGKTVEQFEELTGVDPNATFKVPGYALGKGTPNIGAVKLPQ